MHGGNHWQTFVILPKNHILRNEVALNNSNELAFFKDSYYTNKNIPELFKLLLQNKYEYELEEEKQEVGGIFKDIEFFDKQYTKIMQQQEEEDNDCGWWAVYNAVRFILEGSGNFLTELKDPSRELGYKLRKIFSNLTEQANMKIEEEVKNESINPIDLFFIEGAIKKSLLKDFN